MARIRSLALAGLLLVGPWLAACGTGAKGARERDPLPSVRVAGDERAVDVLASEHCDGETCAQAIRSGPAPDLGTSSTLAVRLPAGEWSVQATMTGDGTECPRSFAALVAPRPGGRHTLSPVGPAGRYRVTLRATGPGESLVASFYWTTTSQGPAPEPTARVRVAVDDGSGPVRSPAVELALSNLAAGPEQAAATVTVRSSDGRQLTPPVQRVAECTGFGVVWHGSADDAPQVEDLGSPPYTYDVEVVLDGVRHRATATWPDDRMSDTDWSVPLTFDPPLPAAR